MRHSEDLEQVHVAWAFPGVASGDDALFAAQVFVTALGGGMSSSRERAWQIDKTLGLRLLSEAPIADRGNRSARIRRAGETR